MSSTTSYSTNPVNNHLYQQLIARAEEEQSRQEQVGAEKARALAAIEAAMRRDEPLASTLKRALGTFMCCTYPLCTMFSSVLFLLCYFQAYIFYVNDLLHFI